MKTRRNKKPYVFEGAKAEQYKKMRNKWIRLSVVSTGLPFIFPIIIGYFNDTLNLVELFGNGEMILSLFSLNIPLVFDLFEMKNKDDEKMSWAFWTCTIVVFLQLAVYCSIRTASLNTNRVKNILTSIIMLICSWLNCSISIKALFNHSIIEEEQK